MKKLISIIVVLTMAFAFSITALAEDVDAINPPDPGEWNDETGNFENVYVEFDEAPPNTNTDTYVYDPDGWDGYDEQMQNTATDYKNSDAYDKNIQFNAVQLLVGTQVIEYDPDVEDWDLDIDDFGGDWEAFDAAYQEWWDRYAVGGGGVGGWVTVINKDWNTDTVKAILQLIGWMENGEWFSEYRLFTSDMFEYDPVTGTLRFYVDDFGWWSEFFALIERGVDPETAMKVLNARSPKTEDTSIHAGIILLIVLSAATATVVISKKARKHD